MVSCLSQPAVKSDLTMVTSLSLEVSHARWPASAVPLYLEKPRRGPMLQLQTCPKDLSCQYSFANKRYSGTCQLWWVLSSKLAFQGQVSRWWLGLGIRMGWGREEHHRVGDADQGWRETALLPDPSAASPLILCNVGKLFTRNGTSDPVSKKSGPWVDVGINK